MLKYKQKSTMIQLLNQCSQCKNGILKGIALAVVS